MKNRSISNFRLNASGNVAIIFALAAPTLLLLIGATLDVASVIKQRSHLQAVADAVAIAAGKELSLAGDDRQRIKATAKAYADAQLNKAYKIYVAVDPTNLRVKVILNTDVETNFGRTFGLEALVDDVTAVAESEVVGKTRVCVLGLDEAETGTIALEKKSFITANGCAVFSNSKAKHGLVSSSASTLRASVICSGGGFKGGKPRYEPSPIVDCPSFEDPLKNRAMPTPPACSETDLHITDETRSLSPGSYCGGLRISGASDITFEPGEYYFVNGPLLVEDTSQIYGREIALVFTGADSRLHFAEETTISLGAPKTGSLAGMLIYEDRTQVSGAQFLIESKYANYLLGTIYIPQGTFLVDGTKPVAENSEYTAIVARIIRLNRSPHLVLNTDYGLTEVPVPVGIKGVGEPVALRQ